MIADDTVTTPSVKVRKREVLKGPGIFPIEVEISDSIDMSSIGWKMISVSELPLWLRAV